jgi:hypothetical protein
LRESLNRAPWQFRRSQQRMLRTCDIVDHIRWQE